MPTLSNCDDFALETVGASGIAEHRSVQNDPLWLRLDAFELDQQDCGLTFSERLARENAWSPTYAQRAIVEYKRFIYLAMRAGHIVCPSDTVDQVWHMHLTYTQSYWNELCHDVLGAPLHHGPTKGGTEEREKFYHLYQRTLASYEELFGTRPPADFWPPADTRFGTDLNFVRINRNRHWIIPKSSTAMIAGGSASVLVLVPSFVMFNPLDWQGQDFLILFFGLLAISTVVGIVARIFQTADAENSKQLVSDPFGDKELGPVDAAFMRDGNRGAIQNALFELLHSNAILLEGSKFLPGPEATNYQANHRVSQLMLQSVREAKTPPSLTRLVREAKVGLTSTAQKLEGKGLLFGWPQRASLAATPLVLLTVTGCLGVMKMVVGFQRGKPIGLLALGELLCLILMVGFLVSIPRVTRSGKRLLERLQNGLESAPVAPTKDLSPSKSDQPRYDDATLMWSAAILGTSVFAGTEYAALDSLYRREIASANTNSSGGCSTSGCGGDGGCGGGCGGCGGCG